MIKRIITFIQILVTFGAYAGSGLIHEELEWKGVLKHSAAPGDTILQPYFPGAQYDHANGQMPLFVRNFQISGNPDLFTVEITDITWDVAPDEILQIPGADLIQEDPLQSVRISYDRGQPTGILTFLPFRKNPYSGQVEWAKSFNISFYDTGIRSTDRQLRIGAASNSVLASGDWYKLSVTETGIHRITYSDLQSMGINPAAIDPRNIRLFGNGGGMLPESSEVFRRDDLTENAIYVSGESDGKFDQQDYVLFYGQSPHRWYYHEFSQAFQHEQNIYSDHTYYFLNTDTGPGKRVVSIASSQAQPDVVVDKFTDYLYHEQDLFNLINTGRVWYGEVFDVSTTYNFSYNIPDLDNSSPALLRAYLAAKSVQSSSFILSSGNTQVLTAIISGIPASSETYARAYIGSDWFEPESANKIDIRINYQKTSSSSIGWLNFFELNYTRYLRFSGAQMSFRNPSAAGPGIVAEYTLGNAAQDVIIWNVTDPTHAGRLQTSASGFIQTFRVEQDTLQEFIAFDGSSYFPVTFVEKVPNQDLHGSGPAEMVIITHPDFLDQAERLASFHRDHDGMTVLVTEIGMVYNEFSSGAQDITAIRDFMNMLYNKAPEGQQPKYLLLFGDASFDYKDRLEGNNNYIPTWEDDESLTIVYSIATDDYYGFMDGPGDNLLDIGIGRLPVSTQEEATLAVDKIVHYATNSQVVMKDWRNTICFVADDEDANLHFNQAEEMAAFLDTNYGEYNIDKIYVDAFPQISTPGGQRAPEVNKAINNRMNKGALVMNYTGHGGEVGWGHERFLEISDINTWSNYDQMPIFITATCEFSRYDDPERVSAGELVYLNPNGGAVAMFTTARATFGGSNFNLNTALFEIMFEQQDGDWYRFGDLIRIAKNRGGVVDNDKKFILLGDPALQLAYPMLDIATTKVNGEAVSETADTLQALSKITIEGEVLRDGSLASSFNGTIFPIVYDKPSLITTLDTDPTSQPATFVLQNNILYKGKAQVTGGKFSFTFIVPKDIAYQYGFGKISYYAEDDNETDAHGYYKNIMVGGLNQSIQPDEVGPEVRLYMNDEGFRSGGITDENPDMLAFAADESGINTIGTGIGHDIVAILDGNTEKPIILNDFYESDLNSYTSGTIRYPFRDLEEGRHILSLKVWDVFNNSGEASLEFVVVRSEQFIIEELMNFPNPFFDNTTFVFSHNQSEGSLDVSLMIFNLAGQVVWTYETTVVPQGYRTEAATWNGRDDSGNFLAQGLYVYRIVVKSSEGQTSGKEGKLLLLN